MKIKKTIIFSIIDIIILLALAIYAIPKIIENAEVKLLKNEEDTTLDTIYFSSYSYNDNEIKILVTAQEPINGIEKIIYTDCNGNQLELDCYGKRKVSIDYVVKENGTYPFKVINAIGETKQKDLIVDDEYRKSFINIQAQPEIEEGRELATKTFVNIDYKDVTTHNTVQYKIGNSSKWLNYTDAFVVDSYTVIANNWQNEDKTITIYARKIDSYGNTITDSININNMDVDLPPNPKVTLIEQSQYATLTGSGPVLPTKFKPVFTGSDVKNYYSLDKGKTWIEYNETDGEIFSELTINIYLKTVKNVSGLEVQMSTRLKPTASDAIGSLAYDGEIGIYNMQESNPNKTYEYWSSRSIEKKIKTDISTENRQLKVWYTNNFNYSYHGMRINFYDDNGIALSNNGNLSQTEGNIGTQILTIPANTSTISIYMCQWSVFQKIGTCCLYEMQIIN